MKQMLPNPHRRALIRVVGGGVIAAATLPTLTACSSALPDEAIAAWQGPAVGVDVRRWILSYAILAPHSHNLQSWLVDLRQPDTIVLYCDPTRLLPETDPFSRQIMMSHGTFLELLAIAARERGLRAEVELFPQGTFAPDKIDQRPVARIRLLADTAIPKDPLFAQITQRHTNREAYADTSVPYEAQRVIAESVAGYAIRVGFMGQDQATLIQQHRKIASDAFRIELSTPRTLLESYKVLRVGPDEIVKYRDGLSLNKPIPRLLVALGLFDRSKASAPDDFAVTSQLKDFDSKLAATPAFFWMITSGNDRPTQVNAGRAYVRAQLAATAQGLAMQPLSQALQEFAEMRQPYAAIHQLLGASLPGQTVQMWARLGYAPKVGPSPRRGLQAHVMVPQA